MRESIRAHIAGAIQAPGEEVGDAYRCCVEAQRALPVQSGCAGLYGTAVARIEVGGRFPAVLTAMGRRIEADRIILCAGTESVRLARALGVRRSEEHTSELQSLMRISYAVFCLKKKKKTQVTTTRDQLSRRHIAYNNQITID